ncbi:MAG: OmpA family protein [Pseudomonadales bacterium]|nr:OmpA family protein [Pseudomonadales bacterium]
MLNKTALLTLSALSVLTLSACVSTSKHEALQQQYQQLQASQKLLGLQGKTLATAKVALTKSLEKLQAEYDQLSAEKASLQETYNALSSRSSKDLVAQAEQNQVLSGQLKLKEAQLALKSQRVDDLERLITAQETQMQALKLSLSKALHNFEGKGLAVEQKNGKIYVSMENKLLFKTGSWAVGVSGQQAVQQLAAVLADNKEVDILIEGHTDNDPFASGTTLLDNWDLSVKRATAIVRIIQAKGVNPTQITAAGRSEFLPVASNDNQTDKAKNRRIEIILAPNLDEIAKLLAQ